MGRSVRASERSRTQGWVHKAELSWDMVDTMVAMDTAALDTVAEECR